MNISFSRERRLLAAAFFASSASFALSATSHAQLDNICGGGSNVPATHLNSAGNVFSGVYPTVNFNIGVVGSTAGVGAIML